MLGGVTVHRNRTARPLGGTLWTLVISLLANNVLLLVEAGHISLTPQQPKGTVALLFYSLATTLSAPTSRIAAGQRIILTFIATKFLRKVNGSVYWLAVSNKMFVVNGVRRCNPCPSRGANIYLFITHDIVLYSKQQQKKKIPWPSLGR